MKNSAFFIRPPPGGRTMYAVLHLADFALQAVLRTEPDSAGAPAALFTANTKKSAVLAANAPARAADVELGMTAPQAVARCPTLLIRTPNAQAEADARAALLAVGFTVSPSIEDTAPGVCTIDLRGASPSLYRRAATAAVRQLQALGFVATAGIGPTPLLALYAARQAHPVAPTYLRRDAPDAKQAELPLGDPSERSRDDSVQTRGPARESKDPSSGAEHAPDREGCVFVVTDADSFLRRLPLAAVDPPPEVAGILASWGLRTLGDVTALSRDAIGQRLGPEGLALWDRAHGGAPRPLHLVGPAQTFEASLEFEDEIETLEPLLFILRRFLDRLTLELRTAGYVAASLTLQLTLASEAVHDRSFRLPEPTADIEILFRALHTHLESLRTDAAIQAVRLQVTPTRPLVRQQGLFDTGLRDPHGFADTLARVAALVGADRVGTPQREDTHRPDAVKVVPPTPVIPPPAEPAPHPVAGLPLRRYRPPLRAQLELTDGRPTYLWTERFHGSIAEVRGAWVSSGDWWQADRAWRRTEYDVSLADGGMYRLVLSDGNWYVEGEYD